MEVQLGRLWKSPLNWQPTGPLNRALGIGNRYLFIPACILTFMALGLVTSISAAHDMFAYREISAALAESAIGHGSH